MMRRVESVTASGEAALDYHSDGCQFISPAFAQRLLSKPSANGAAKLAFSGPSVQQ
jgi:hypothetical protein